MEEVDLFVIGAGSGGVRCARLAAQAGARVAVAEARYLGGTCVNVGCIPKKLYSYAAQYRYDFEDSRNFGWDTPLPRFDWEVLRRNKSTEITRLNGIYQGLLEKAGARVLQGHARILGPRRVAVEDSVFDCRNILIATGGWPQVPDMPGRDLCVTSNEVFDLPVFPERVLVVGGGYVAVEFAGIFAGLGARTCLAYRRDLPLNGFDEDTRRFFLREMQKHVQLRLNSVPTAVESVDDGLRVHFSSGDDLVVDCVLLATGRIPNTQGLGLENTAVRLDERGRIQVDENLQTDEPGVYAVGDVVGRLELTPVALAEGTMLANRLFAGKASILSYENVPTAIFSHPNIGTVGLSEEEARRRHANVVVYKSEFRALKHTVSGRDERTFMKLLVNGDDDRVLGIHMVGHDAGETIQGFAVAMNCGLTKALLDATLGIHPTAAEEFVTMRTPSS